MEAPTFCLQPISLGPKYTLVQGVKGIQTSVRGHSEDSLGPRPPPTSPTTHPSHSQLPAPTPRLSTQPTPTTMLSSLEKMSYAVCSVSQGERGKEGQDSPAAITNDTSPGWWGAGRGLPLSFVSSSPVGRGWLSL